MIIKTPEGFKINYIIKRKKGKPFIIFFHGLAGNYKEFTHQIKEFSKEYSILAFDILGHGESDKPKEEKYYRADYAVKIIINFIKKEKIANPILIGFSMGGFLASKLSEKIKVKKLILINPGFGYSAITPFFLIGEWFSQFMPEFFLKKLVKSYNIYEYNGLIDEYAKMLLKTPFYVHNTIIKNSKNEKMPELKQKAYVIKSKQDEIVNAYLPLKNYELIKINGFHMVHVQHSKEINQIIREIITS